MIKGVYNKFADKEEKGDVVITRYTFERKKDLLYNLMNRPMMYMVDGDYVRMHVGGKLMMSDTQMEKDSNWKIISKSHGRVLIAGLGIGMVLENILDKPEVEEVIVIENNQNVIDLVHPKFEHPKLRVIKEDIFNYKPAKGEKFDVIYFDIWPDICIDNLDDIKKLHNKFKYFKNKENPKSWMNSWMNEYLQNERRKEKKNSWYW